MRQTHLSTTAEPTLNAVRSIMESLVSTVLEVMPEGTAECIKEPSIPSAVKVVSETRPTALGNTAETMFETVQAVLNSVLDAAETVNIPAAHVYTPGRLSPESNETISIPERTPPKMKHLPEVVTTANTVESQISASVKVILEEMTAEIVLNTGDISTADNQRMVISPENYATESGLQTNQFSTQPQLLPEVVASRKSPVADDPALLLCSESGVLDAKVPLQENDSATSEFEIQPDSLTVSVPGKVQQSVSCIPVKHALDNAEMGIAPLVPTVENSATVNLSVDESLPAELTSENAEKTDGYPVKILATGVTSEMSVSLPSPLSSPKHVGSSISETEDTKAIQVTLPETDRLVPKEFKLEQSLTRGIPVSTPKQTGFAAEGIPAAGIPLPKEFMPSNIVVRTLEECDSPVPVEISLEKVAIARTPSTVASILVEFMSEQTIQENISESNNHIHAEPTTATSETRAFNEPTLECDESFPMDLTPGKSSTWTPQGKKVLDPVEITPEKGTSQDLVKVVDPMQVVFLPEKSITTTENGDFFQAELKNKELPSDSMQDVDDPNPMDLTSDKSLLSNQPASEAASQVITTQNIPDTDSQIPNLTPEETSERSKQLTDSHAPMEPKLDKVSTTSEDSNIGEVMLLKAAATLASSALDPSPKELTSTKLATEPTLDTEGYIPVVVTDDLVPVDLTPDKISAIIPETGSSIPVELPEENSREHAAQTFDPILDEFPTGNLGQASGKLSPLTPEMSEMENTVKPEEPMQAGSIAVNTVADNASLTVNPAVAVFPLEPVTESFPSSIECIQAETVPEKTSTCSTLSPDDSIPMDLTPGKCVSQVQTEMHIALKMELHNVSTHILLEPSHTGLMEFMPSKNIMETSSETDGSIQTGIVPEETEVMSDPATQDSAPAELMLETASTENIAAANGLETKFTANISLESAHETNSSTPVKVAARHAPETGAHIHKVHMQQKMTDAKLLATDENIPIDLTPDKHAQDTQPKTEGRIPAEIVLKIETEKISRTVEPVQLEFKESCDTTESVPKPEAQVFLSPEQIASRSSSALDDPTPMDLTPEKPSTTAICETNKLTPVELLPEKGFTPELPTSLDSTLVYTSDVLLKLTTEKKEAKQQPETTDQKSEELISEIIKVHTSVVQVESTPKHATSVRELASAVSLQEADIQEQLETEVPVPMEIISQDNAPQIVHEAGELIVVEHKPTEDIPQGRLVSETESHMLVELSPEETAGGSDPATLGHFPIEQIQNTVPTPEISFLPREMPPKEIVATHGAGQPKTEDSIPDQLMSEMAEACNLSECQLQSELEQNQSSTECVPFCVNPIQAEFVPSKATAEDIPGTDGSVQAELLTEENTVVKKLATDNLLPIELVSEKLVQQSLPKIESTLPVEITQDVNAERHIPVPEVNVPGELIPESVTRCVPEAMDYIQTEPSTDVIGARSDSADLPIVLSCASDKETENLIPLVLSPEKVATSATLENIGTTLAEEIAIEHMSETISLPIQVMQEQCEMEVDCSPLLASITDTASAQMPSELNQAELPTLEVNTDIISYNTPLSCPDQNASDTLALEPVLEAAASEDRVTVSDDQSCSTHTATPNLETKPEKVSPVVAYTSSEQTIPCEITSEPSVSIKHERSLCKSSESVVADSQSSIFLQTDCTSFENESNSDMFSKPEDISHRNAHGTDMKVDSNSGDCDTLKMKHPHTLETAGDISHIDSNAVCFETVTMSGNSISFANDTVSVEQHKRNEDAFSKQLSSHCGSSGNKCEESSAKEIPPGIEYSEHSFLLPKHVMEQVTKSQTVYLPKVYPVTETCIQSIIDTGNSNIGSSDMMLKLLKWIKSKRELGVMETQLKKKFSSMQWSQHLRKIISVLIQHYLIIRVGITCFRYVAIEFCKPWVVNALLVPKDRQLQARESFQRESQQGGPRNKRSSGCLDSETEPPKKLQKHDQSASVNQSSTEASSSDELKQEKVEVNSSIRSDPDPSSTVISKCQENILPNQEGFSGSSVVVSSDNLDLEVLEEVHIHTCAPSDPSIDKQTIDSEHVPTPSTSDGTTQPPSRTVPMSKTAPGLCQTRRRRRHSLGIPSRPLQTDKWPKVQFVPRVWRKPDGRLNRPVLHKLLSSVFGHLLTFPGISEEDICEHFSPALQPVNTLELLEILEHLQCIRRVYLKTSHLPSLFSAPVEYTQHHDDVGTYVFVLYEPLKDAILKFGQFSDFFLIQH